MTDSAHSTDSAPAKTLADVEKGLDMPLQEAMLTQRAIRRLRPDAVDDAIVLRCIELALKAPTGSNGQNWEFLVVKDSDAKAALARENRRSSSLYLGIGRRQNRADDAMLRIIDAVQWQADHFEEIPVLIVPCLRGNHVPFVPAASRAPIDFRRGDRPPGGRQT